MMIHEFADAAAFLDRSAALLLENEAENNLILGAASHRAKGAGRADDQAWFCAVEDQGRVIASAMWTPPYKLVLTRGPAPAIAMIADRLSVNRAALSGVLGPTEPVELFLLAWRKLSRQKPHPGTPLRIHQLTAVIPPPAPSGSFHEATFADFDLLVAWKRSFMAEIGDQVRVDERQFVITSLNEHRLFIWKDPQPVSLAGWTDPTPGGVRINTVYTPPESRRRGYASACVATLSQRLLDSGRKFCFLYADRSNPTSNGIYRRIGYELVCDIAEVYLQ